MKVRARVANPDAVELTLQVSMTVNNWKKLSERLNHSGSSFPEWKLRDAVTRALARVTAVMEEDVDVTEETK